MYSWHLSEWSKKVIEKISFVRFSVAVALLLTVESFATAEITGAESEVPIESRRGVEQTLLTYPEWFLVHSPAEYAALVNHRPAHEFPFLAHIGQIWSSYSAVTGEQVRAGYPMNFGYHLMICVIAASTTVEYAIRSGYENVMGRVSWALSAETPTSEDIFGAAVAQDYVDFIRHEPWYLYNFTSKLIDLWRDTPIWEPNPIRKIERRYALTTEYLMKALYGKIIERATRATYSPALMTTEVVVDHVPPPLPPALNVTLIKKLNDGRALVSLPRYFDFRIAATELAKQEIHLTDIAGNTSVILVTVWANDESKIDRTNNRILFAQPLLTMPGKRRIALLIPISKVSAFLLAAPENGMQVEHVYDY
jgi:hypothetical protein